MDKKREEWIDDVLNSLNNIKAVKAPAHITGNVMLSINKNEKTHRLKPVKDKSKDLVKFSIIG